MEGMPFLIVLGSGVVLLGLAIVIWIAISKQREHGTPNWPHVEGEILESLVVPFSRETARGTEYTYTPVIKYRYTVDGLPYTSDNRNFLPDTTATSEDPLKATSVVSRYPAGSWIKVYYNPVNPKQAALEIPKPAAHNAVMFYGIANILAGAMILALGILLM